MNYLLCKSTVLDKKRKAADKLTVEQKQQVAKEFEDIANKFHTGFWKNIKDTGYNDMNTFDFLYYKATGMPFDPGTWSPTMIDARKFKMRINRFNKNLGQTDGWISSFFKLPRTVLKKLPELQKFQQEMIYETSFFRKNTFAGNKRVNSMLSTFKDIATELGSNTKEYSRIEKALDEAEVIGDLKNINKYQLQKLNFLKKGSGKAYIGLMKALQGADINTLDELPSRKSKANMHKIMGHWRELRTSSAKSLVRGMEKIVTLAKGNARNEKLVERMQSRIRAIKFQEVIDKEGNTIPGEKFKADADILKYGFTVEEKNSYMARDSKGQLYVRYRQYMPHYVLGIPKMLYTAEKIFKGGDGESIADLNKTIETELGSLDNIIRRIEKRNEGYDTIYHVDPFFFFKKYVSDVSIFNYKTHIKDTFRRAYSDLTNNHLEIAKQSGNKNSVEMLENMLKMTHDVYNTLHNIDPYRDTTRNNLMRFMTSLTYFRLLGGNIRSAARNATQRIHEIHNFGIGGVSEANAYYTKVGGAEQNVELVNRKLKEYGLLWFSGKNVRHKLLDSLTGGEGTGITEASRGALGESFIADYGLKVTKNGEIVRDTATPSKSLAQTTSKIAEKSAFMHRLVEDWNRTNTFKVAFALVHQNLGKMSPEWLQKQSGKTDPKAINEWKANEAGKMAYIATLDIHYEYAKWAKAKGLQTGPGQFLGQFMHYRFSLFDMMYKWIDDAGIALRAGDFTGQETWRLMRFGMTSAMIGGVFAPLLNTKLSGLFQNDVIETAETAYKYLSADRDNKEEMEELDKKTFGQGGFYFLGPNVNFLLSLNELQDHFFMDETKHSDYLKDIDFIPEEQTNKRFKLMSLVNAQLARTWNYTAPLFYQRGIIDAARMELGLFPDRDIRDIRRMAKQWMGRNIHPSLGVTIKKRGRPRTTPLSDEERKAALKSVTRI